MFRKSLVEQSIDAAVTKAAIELREIHAGTAEYDEILDKLERLSKVRNNTSSDRVSADTLATIIANLAGIGMILQYERAHVVTSKALGFIMKLR